jgi:hypothetical protein
VVGKDVNTIAPAAAATHWVAVKFRLKDGTERDFEYRCDENGDGSLWPFASG